MHKGGLKPHSFRFICSVILDQIEIANPKLPTGSNFYHYLSIIWPTCFGNCVINRELVFGGYYNQRVVSCSFLNKYF